MRNVIHIVKRKAKQWILLFTRKNFSFIEEEIMRKFNSQIIEAISGNIKIIDPSKTLQIVKTTIEKKEKGAYMRFGDGDAYLSVGINDMLQTSNTNLKNEMIEAFSLHGSSVFKCLSIHSELYGKEKEMYVGNHLVSNELANRLLSYVFPYFIGNIIYSPIALHYTATYEPLIAHDFLKTLKKYCSVFVGNQDTPDTIIKKLFGEVKHVKTPSRNAYTDIDRIEKETSVFLDKVDTFSVVVVAMGCSGRPLMKRLHIKKHNIFLFDFGSLLDGICGNETRTWLKKTDIDYSTLLNNL